MLASEEAAVDEGYSKIILSTFEDNKLARGLYDSLDYRVVGIRERHFKMNNGHINEILMEKWVGT
jgi:ribosomal protein S18 acetylase RimI-like enzyme